MDRTDIDIGTKEVKKKFIVQSANGISRKEIHFIITNKKEAVQDTNIINKSSTGRDYKIVRAKIVLHVTKERKNMVARIRKVKFTSSTNKRAYQNELESNLQNSAGRNKYFEQSLLGVLNKCVVKQCKMKNSLTAQGS